MFIAEFAAVYQIGVAVFLLVIFHTDAGQSKVFHVLKERNEEHAIFFRHRAAFFSQIIGPQIGVVTPGSRPFALAPRVAHLE